MKSQEVINIDDEGEMTPPPQKKMKQARLPFQVLTPKVVEKDVQPSVPLAKRRRLTDEADDIQVVKLVKSDVLELRTESKENVCDIADENNEVVAEEKLSQTVKESEEALCAKKLLQNDTDNKNLVDESVENCVSDGKPNNESCLLPQPKIVDESSDLEESENESDSDKIAMDVSMELPAVEPSTPKNATSLLDTSGKESSRKLTPRQIEKLAEREKLRQEKLRLKQEKEDQKKKEKEQKEEQKRKEREEKEDQKKKEREEKEDQKRREKEEKEDQKKREREEKEKKKQSELEQRNEEKRLKDEEKRKKEQAEETAKSKTAKRFTSFFVPRKSDSNFVESIIPVAVENKQNFMPFQVKGDMRLAPLVRKNFTTKAQMDKALKEQDATTLYLSQLKNRQITTSAKTWPLSDIKNEVVILEADDKLSEPSNDNMILEPEPVHSNLRVKLLQFHQNRRPPYWGTWRKKSALIRPTVPFAKDSELLDYEVDSDDEWEEEEPGESIHGTDDEKESVDDYEIDNEFFVPHGYLSDEEEKEEGNEVMSPETQKAKLKFLELEFEEEMKHKTERIKPRLLGCFWASNYKDIAGTQLMKLLDSRRVVFRNEPIQFPTTPTSFAPSSPGLNSSMGASPLTAPWVKKIKLPADAIPALIRLIHGNTNSRVFLVKEFCVYWENRRGKATDEANADAVPPSPGVLAQKSVSNKIKELANWMPCLDDGPLSGKMCWYVSQELRSIHGLEDLQVPNAWTYSLKPRRTKEKIGGDPTCPGPSPGSTPKHAPLITNFTKTVTLEEKQKQFQAISSGTAMSSGTAVPSASAKKSLITNFTKVLSQEDKEKQMKTAASAALATGLGTKSPTVATLATKKRASILFSVPRGQDIPKQANSSAVPCSVAPSNMSPPASSKLNASDNSTNVEKNEPSDKVEAMDVITID